MRLSLPKFNGAIVRIGYFMSFFSLISRRGCINLVFLSPMVLITLLFDVVKKCWRPYINCRLVGSPSLTWTPFYEGFLERLMLYRLRDKPKDEFYYLEKAL